MKHRITYLLPALLLAACTAEPTVINRPEPDAPASAASSRDTTHTGAVIEPADAQTPLPPSVRIEMPFASQAPLGNWDPPYDEACEEASLIIVHHYLEGTPLDANIMDSDIIGMVAHEESVGMAIDIDMHELAQVAREMYGYETEVVEGPEVTAERIEQEIARGNPVILPLAGQDVGNPYYSGDGPPYHVLVVLGYDERNFVTHDVGTRRGAYYEYRKDVLMDAIHDWNGSVDTIRSGPRRMLIVTKP